MSKKKSEESAPETETEAPVQEEIENTDSIEIRLGILERRNRILEQEIELMKKTDFITADSLMLQIRALMEALSVISNIHYRNTDDEKILHHIEELKKLTEKLQSKEISQFITQLKEKKDAIDSAMSALRPQTAL